MTTITVTPVPASVPPKTQIVVEDLPAGVQMVTVWRRADGQRVEVRGAFQDQIGGATSYFVEDYEAPFGRDLTYTVQAWGASGVNLGSAQASPVMLDVAAAWVQDPFSPGTAAAVPAFTSESFVFGFARSGSVVPVIGSRLPVAVTDVRQEASDIPVGLIAPTRLQAAALRLVLQSADPLLLRIPASWDLPVPGAAFITTDSVVEQPYPERDGSGFTAGTTVFALTGTLVAGPRASVVVPTRTYADLLTEAETYGDQPAVYDTYLDMLRGS